MTRASLASIAILVTACGSRTVSLQNSLDQNIPIQADFASVTDRRVPADEPSPLCKTDSYICNGTRIEICNPSGTTSLVLDCATLDLPGRAFTCVPCAAGTPTCKSALPEITGMMSGPISATFSGGAGGCSSDPKITTIFSTSHVQMIQKVQFPDGRSFEVTLSGGDICSAAGPVFTNGIFPQIMVKTSGKTGCTNNSQNPPGLGYYTLTCTGTTRGSEFHLKMDGFLKCTPPGTWEPFTYEANGIAP